MYYNEEDLKSEMKNQTKSLFISFFTIVFVYHSHIWFASKRDPSTCFSSFYNRLDGLGSSLKKENINIRFGDNDRNLKKKETFTIV